jgi:hypothetical protein
MEARQKKVSEIEERYPDKDGNRTLKRKVIYVYEKQNP